MEHWVSLNVTLNLYGPQNRGICHFSLINTFQMDPDESDGETRFGGKLGGFDLNPGFQ